MTYLLLWLLPLGEGTTGNLFQSPSSPVTPLLACPLPQHPGTSSLTTLLTSCLSNSILNIFPNIPHVPPLHIRESSKSHFSYFVYKLFYLCCSSNILIVNLFYSFNFQKNAFSTPLTPDTVLHPLHHACTLFFTSLPHSPLVGYRKRVTLDI